jgi:hypothetical protein
MFPKTLKEQTEDLDERMQNLYDKMGWGNYENPLDKMGWGNYENPLDKTISPEESLKMKEAPAKGKKGYLLYSPFVRKEHRYFFRIYNSDGTFTDYDIDCEELEVEILCDWVAFYENENGKKTLDWSSRALGR